MVIGLLAIILFSLVDTWFISLLGTTELAAISFLFPVIFIIISLSIGMGIGMAASLGRILGSGDHERAARFTTDGILLTLLLIGVISVAGYLTIDPLFTALGAKEDTMPFIHDYISIWYLGVGFLVVQMIGNNAIRATGDTKSPSFIMFVAGILNGIMDPLLIFGVGPFPELGVKGAAIATALSWALTFFLAFYILYVREKLLTFARIDLKEMLSNWALMARIGVPAAVGQMMNPLGNSFLVAMLAVHGNAAVAAFGVGVRLEGLLMIMIMAISSIIPVVMGQNVGARLFERARSSLLYAIHYALVLQLLIAVVIFLFAPVIAGWFTKDPDVLALSTLFLQVVPISYGPLAVTLIFSQALNTLHMPNASLMMISGRLFLISVPLAWFGSKLWGPEGLIVALSVSYLLSGLVMYLFTRWFILNSRTIGRHYEPSADVSVTDDEVQIVFRLQSIKALNFLLPVLKQTRRNHPGQPIHLIVQAAQNDLPKLQNKLEKMELPETKLSFQHFEELGTLQ